MFPLMIIPKLSIIFQDIQCIPTVSRFQRDSIQKKNGILNKEPQGQQNVKGLPITWVPNEGAKAISHAYRKVFPEA